MPWLVDSLAAIYYSSGDWGKFILLVVFFFGFLILLLDLWGRSSVNRKSPEDYLYCRLSEGYIHFWHQWGSEGLSDDEIKFQKKLMDAGLDWILETCIIRSPKGLLAKNNLEFSHTKMVVAAWAGYVKDVRGPEDNYRWIVELQNGRFMYLKGFFDPSGFYSHTRLFMRLADTPEKAALFEIRPKTLQRMNKDQDVYAALLDQIKSGERDWAGFKWGTDYTP